MGASIAADAGSNGTIISSLDSGNYALRITNNVTQCVNVLYASVNIALLPPVATATSVPSTYCPPVSNGELHGLADGQTSGFTFFWYSVDLADTLVNNSPDIFNLQPGDYLLTVVNDTTACASNPTPVTIDDTPVIPTATFTSQDQISCDPVN